MIVHEQHTFSCRDDGDWESLSQSPDNPTVGYVGMECARHVSELSHRIHASLARQGEKPPNVFDPRGEVRIQEKCPRCKRVRLRWQHETLPPCECGKDTQ